jgi:hypothetical protein
VDIDVGWAKGGESGITRNIPFLPDSGANLTAICPADLRQMGLSKRNLACMLPPPTPPQTADGSTSGLRPVGVFRGGLHFRRAGTVTQCDIWVLEGLAQPILSRAACFELSVLESCYLRGGKTQ